MVHFERLIGRIDRNDRFARRVAVALVEFALVAEGKPALLAAVGTECGRRNQILDARENGGNFVVKLEVFVRD